MKHNLITLKALSAALIAAAALAGCQREAIGPEASALDPAADEIVIPVSVEPTRYDDDTRVALNASTGACTWEDNDLVALYISGKNAYVSSGVVGGAVRLSIGSTDSRTNYAIYPAASAASDYSTPKVIYPASYDMRYKSDNYCPTPMVADNTQDALAFYHVGGVLRLHLLNVPANTTSIAVTFTGMSKVNGTFSVDTSSGLENATCTVEGSGTNVITFTKTTKFCTTDSDLYLNVPLPTQDYSSLTSISVAVSGGTGTTASVNVSGWGELGHGQGKKLTVNFVSITHLSGYTGKFRGYYISPGILKWDDSLNGGQGGYTLTDGNDPLELLRYYGQSSSQGVYYHQFNDGSSTTNTKTLKYRLDGANNTSYDIINRTITIDGLVWKIPDSPSGAGVMKAIWNSSATSATLNSTSNARYVNILVDLATATNVNGTDYSAKGLSTASAGSGTNQGYQAGLLLIPDNVTISCVGLTANNTSFTTNKITWAKLKVLLDGGCVFLPAAGGNNGSWANGGTQGNYWSSTRDASSNAYSLYFGNNSLTVTTPGKTYYYPVRLVRE